jgi:hypothetical protein
VATATAWQGPGAGPRHGMAQVGPDVATAWHGSGGGAAPQRGRSLAAGRRRRASAPTSPSFLLLSRLIRHAKPR